MPRPSAEQVRELFDYDAETGVLTWKKPSSPNVKIGELAGSINGVGYLLVGVGRRKMYSAHRLVWAHFYGVWPEGGLDHINGNRTDNSITNLRLASTSENAANRRRQKNNKSGFKGVHFVFRRGKWRARLGVARKQLELGFFSTPEEAHAAYMRAAVQHFGEFARSE